MAPDTSDGPAGRLLAATVARRHYLEGASKSEIAGELGLSRFKVARLLDHARATGLVRIEVDPGEALDLELSLRLQEALGLRHCVVVAAPEDDDALLRAALGRTAAALLAEIVEPQDVLGLVWGRSLLAMRAALTRLAPCPVVALTGALQRPDVPESSVELVRDVARVSGGTAHSIYAPMIVPDAATARVMRTQPEIARVLALGERVTKAVVGVGAWAPGLSTVADALSAPERREVRELGVRAETGGIGLDAEGAPVTTPLSARRIGIEAEHLRAVPDVIGLVYGAVKADAVRAAVRGGFVTSVVTHPGMARALLRPPSPPA